MKPIENRDRTAPAPVAAKAEGGIDRRPVPERVAVLVPLLKQSDDRDRVGRNGERRTAEAQLAEAVGLAQAINLEICLAQAVTVAAIRPSTYFGKGKVEEIGGVLAIETADVAFVDTDLTPVQQRNLERAWNVKVIDRTGLILEIFGDRAQTREGRLQVDLAHLNYQKSRLVRSWTHLERQRGGLGFVGGPGETQIEADRRILQQKITRLEKDLAQVKRTRDLHRVKRHKAPYPVVALVGYTNAGKSTLFNALTGADVYARDQLFATLDPTMRLIALPHGGSAILSDTVGFISNLPTQLVAAFRATLEEVMLAEVILHVRDISHPDTEIQARDVDRTLKILGIDPETDPRVIEVWNKIDLAPGAGAGAAGRPVAISALTGAGIDALLLVIEEQLARASRTFTVRVPVADGELLAWLHERHEVLERAEPAPDDTTVQLRLRVAPERADQFRSRAGSYIVKPE